MYDRTERIVGDIGAEDLRNEIVAVIVGEYRDVRNSLAAAHPGRHDDVLRPIGGFQAPVMRFPLSGFKMLNVRVVTKPFRIRLVFDQPDAVADHAQGDEIILRVRRLRQLHHVEDMAARLIKGFDCGQHISVGKLSWLPPARPQCHSDRCQSRRFVRQTGCERGSRLVRMRNWAEIRSSAPTLRAQQRIDGAKQNDTSLEMARNCDMVDSLFFVQRIFVVSVMWC